MDITATKMFFYVPYLFCFLFRSFIVSLQLRKNNDVAAPRIMVSYQD